MSAYYNQKKIYSKFFAFKKLYTKIIRQNNKQFNKNMTTKNKNIITKILLSIFVSSFFIVPSFAENVDVTANLESGTYNKVIKVELTSTDNSTKTFYTFDPNSWPWDTILYTWAILIKKSTPLLFFSFLSTSNESKIKQNNYIINYPSNIKFSAWAKFNNWNIESLQIINNSSDNIDLGYWIVKNDWSNIEIPENTIIQAWWTYNISGITGTWAVTLYSPDEEKKDSIDIIAPIIEQNNTETIGNENINSGSDNQNTNKEEMKEISIAKPIKKVSTNKTPNKVALVTKETPKVNQELPEDNTNKALIWENTNSWINAGTNENWITPSVETQDNTQNNSFNNSLKTSIKETWNTSNNANYVIFGLLLLSFFGWIILKKLTPKQSWN